MQIYKITVAPLAFLLLFDILLMGCAENPTDLPQTSTHENEIIYGTDDRTDHYAVTDPMMLSIFDSTAALFDNNDISERPDGTYDLNIWSWGTFGEYGNLCETERFWNQPVPSYCSAFVVGEDLIASAGHCLSESECSDYSYVFGFYMEDEDTPVDNVGPDDVYQCVEIVGRVNSWTNDWEIVRVDRPIVGHPPLPVRYDGAVEDDEEVFSLFSIGYPVGSPAKLVGGNSPATETGLNGAEVKDVFDEYFMTNMDFHSGNSGSLVFSVTESGEFLYSEGVYVRGVYEWQPSGDGCFVSYQCSDEAGCGPYGWEESTRVTMFSHMVPGSCGDGSCQSWEDCFSCFSDCDCGELTFGDIAVEDFESRVLTEGVGWSAGSWIVNGDATLIDSGDDAYLRLRAGNASAWRTISTLNASEMLLTFDARVKAFEADDVAHLSLTTDGGATWSLLHTFTDADSDNLWHTYSFDVSDELASHNFGIRFDANMSSNLDVLFVDDITLEGMH